MLRITIGSGKLENTLLVDAEHFVWSQLYDHDLYNLYSVLYDLLLSEYLAGT